MRVLKFILVPRPLAQLDRLGLAKEKVVLLTIIYWLDSWTKGFKKIDSGSLPESITGSYLTNTVRHQWCQAKH